MALFTLDEFENIVSDQKKINTNENFQRLINAGLTPAQSSTLPTATPRKSTGNTGKANRTQQQLNQRLNNVAKNKKNTNSNLLINPNDNEAIDYSKIYKKNAPTIDTEKLKKDLGADYELFASQGISGGNNPEYIGALGENFLTGVKNVGRNIANAVDSIKTTNTKEQRLIQAVDRVRAENPTNQSIEKGIQKAVNNVNPYTVQRQREQESIKRTVERQQRTRQETAKNDEFYGNLPGYGAVKLVGQGVGALAPTIAVNAVAPGAGSAIFATNVYGRAFTEAVGDGATYKQAKQYARLDTALEFATEHLFGGIKNVTPEGSVAGNILNKLDWRNMSDKFVKTDVGRYLFKKVLDVTGEGAEEVISEVVTPFLKRAVYNPNTELADLSDVLSAFGGGALVAAVLGAINAPNEFREINNDYYYSKYNADGTSASDMSDVQKWFDGIDDLESARAKYREYVKAYSDVRNSAEADPARAAELASITNGYNTLKTILKNNGASTATASAQTAETATEQPQAQNQVNLLSQGLNGENSEISRVDVNVQPTSENLANVLPSVAELERTITNSGVNISPAELDRILDRNTAPAREVSPDISRLEQAAVDSGIKATAEEVRNIRTAEPEQTKKSIVPKTKWKDRLNEILSSDDTDKAKQLERLKDGVKSTPAKNAIQAEIDKIKPATATTANIDTTDLSKMSDEQLQKVDNQFTTEIEKVKDNLAELASKRSVAANEMPKEYYREQGKLTELRNSHRNVTDEISKRKSEKAKAEPAEKKTFVNAFGEATKREITTATYKRREKRNDKDILRNLGYNPATSRDISTPQKQVNREALEKRLKVAQSEENTTSRVRARRLLVKQGIDWQTGEEMPVKLTAAQVNKIRDIADRNRNKNYRLFSNNGTEYYQDEVLYRLSPDGNIKKALTFAKTGEILNDPNTVKVATVNYNEGVVPDGRTVSEIKARNEKQSTNEQMTEPSVYTKPQARIAPKTAYQQLTENSRILNQMEPLVNLTSAEFPKADTSLVERVEKYFKSFGNKVHRNDFGDVILDKYGIKSTIGHTKLNKYIASTFKAVPNVIENGVLINYENNWKNRNYETYIFAGAITIDGKRSNMAVIVRKNENDNRYYLHEVIPAEIKEDTLSPLKTGLKGNLSPVNDKVPSTSTVPHTAAESQEAGAKVPQKSNKVTEKAANDKSSDVVLKATIPGGNRLESLINQIAKSKNQGSNTEKSIDDMSIEELARELAESREVINDIIENKDEPKVIKEKLEKHHYKATPQIITKIQSFYGYKGTLPESMTDNEDGVLFRTEETLKPQGRNVKLTKKETKRYNEATEFYGEVQEKKGGAREVQIPKSVEFDENDNLSEEEHKFVSESAKTMAQSPAFSDEYAETMKKAVLDGVFSYEKQENQKTLDKATEKIEELGFSGAYNHWNKVVEGKSTYKLEDFALGVKLMQNAAENNDIKRAVEIASGLQMFSTLGAQTVQFGNVWRKLTPEGRLYTVQMTVNHINRQQASYVNKTVQELADEKQSSSKKKGKNKPVTVPPELLEKLMNAGNDLKERERIMEEIEQNIADQLPGTWDEKLRSLRFLGMLGNPRTHVRNFTGNVLMIAPSFAKNEIGALLELTIPKEERTKAGLGKLRKTRSKERKEFIDAEFDRYKDMITGNKKYDFKGGIQAKRTMFKTLKPLNTLSKFNSDMLEKEDEMFLKFHFGYQYRMVMARRGLTVNDIKKNDKLRLEIANIAAQEAQINTFRDYNGAAVSISRRKAGLRRKAQDKSKTLVSRGINGAGYAMAEGLLPFTTTPANIFRRGVEYSPAGLVNGIYQTLFEVKQGKVTAGQAIDKITKGLTGTAIMALGAYFAAKGWVKGQSSDDSKQKTIDKLKGRQEYALQIGDTTYTIDWAAPSIMPFLVGANIYQDAMSNGGLTLSKIVDGILAMADTMTDLSLLQGINSAIKAVRYNDNAITGTGEYLVTSYAGQYVPTLSGQIARTLDPVRRNAYFNDKTVDLPQWVQVFINQQKAKIPVVSQGVVPYVDAWGNIEKQSDNVFARAAENFLSPGYISKINNDPVTNEVERLYKQTGDGACVPSVAEKTITKDGTKINLSGEQWVKYAQEKGQLSHAMVKKAITSADYKSLSDKDKVEVLSKIYSYANEIAKNKTVNTELERTDKDRQILLDSGLNPATLFTRKNQADVDENNSLSATEVFNYLESRDDIDLYQAMYMFDLLAPPKTKTNPYEVAYYGYDE